MNILPVGGQVIVESNVYYHMLAGYPLRDLLHLANLFYHQEMVEGAAISSMGDSMSGLSVLKLNRQQMEQLLSEESLVVRLENGTPVQVQLVEDGVALPSDGPEKHFEAFTLQEKINIFASLFAGRCDVYAVRWEGKAGKTGYSPVCENQWRPGVCQLPKIKCNDCLARKYSPLTDQVLEQHLRGEKTVGLYPLFPDSSCHFLAFDCDGMNWSADSKALMATIRDWNLPAYRERSRSGDGAHIWLFFASPVSARQARILGTVIMTKTMEKRPELGLASYDRMFPNQDWMPEGGFGNLIALPLQKEPRAAGNSVFIDDRDQPFPDQWAVLAKMERISQDEIASRIRDNAGDGNFLGVETVTIDETQEDSWSHVSGEPGDLFSAAAKVQLNSKTAAVTLRLDGEICVRLSDDEGGLLPSAVKNKLIRLAAFQNPEFYQAQRLRLNTFQIPRVIGCAVEEKGWLRLPRGLEITVRECLIEIGFTTQIQDDRNTGQPIEVNFAGALRADQQKAVDAVLKYETGILCAPTGFGKTVLACSILSSRKVNTLILVHRGQLVDQWRSQLKTLLDIPKDKTIGIFGKGIKKLGGYIDVATIQSLYQDQKVDPLVKNYGQIIMDECHHVSAFSFEQVLRAAPARFVLGLTATPVRRDGLHPIMFMQCGPMRVKVKRQKTDMAYRQEVIWKSVPSSSTINNDMKVTDLYAALTHDTIRTDLIVSDVLTCLEQGRFPLILTERKAHLDIIHEQLAARTTAAIAILYGGQGKKVRTAFMKLIDESKAGPRAILATGKLIGEGFDLPDLDTLIIALPISWRGTLQQYVGRLSRNCPEKSLIQVYDYLDQSHPILLRMVEKRLTGYKMLGFETKV